MPELPEVETIRCCIGPRIVGAAVTEVVVRNAGLRRRVSPDLPRQLRGLRVTAVERRAKYLLVRLSRGTLIIHLGMTGRLRIAPSDTPASRHDHLDFVLDNGSLLRFNDSRRFGCVLWTDGDPLVHPLLVNLGPEPLEDAFDGAQLWRRARGRTLAVKSFIMDSRVVAGVGNIYANEALFEARIDPAVAAGRISPTRYRKLAAAIREVLGRALAAGGTTLRDYCDIDGNPGFFQLELHVYGRAGDPCAACGRAIQVNRQGQRATYYCRRCQK
jgi:formamidopyrimidine-DNA glycosylase